MYSIQLSAIGQAEEIEISLCIPCWSECQSPSGSRQHGVVMLVMYLYILSKFVFTVLVVIHVSACNDSTWAHGV